MNLKNTTDSYGVVAKILHWLMVLMIFGLLAVGFIMTDMEPTPDKFKLYGTHKSVGMLLLMLVGFRLGWKLFNVSPELPNSIPKHERLLARFGHFLLYGLMIAMPVSGWIMSSSAGFPVSVFGWFTAPNLVDAMPEWKEFFEETHEIIAWCIIVMVGLHSFAALLHHFYYRNNVLRRMLPFSSKGHNVESSTVRESDTLTGC